MLKSSTNNTKQAAWVAIGSMCSFLIGIISPMILSRYFSKADYGTYKQVMYVYNTLLVIFTLGLPKSYSYFIPKAPADECRSLINKITGIFLLLGVVFSVFLLLCSDVIADILKNPDLSIALKLFSPVPLLLLPTMGLESIYATYKKTKQLLFYTVSTRILSIVCIVLPVLFSKGNYIDAIIGFDFASLITCLLALYMKSIPTKGLSNRRTQVSYRQILQFSIPLLYASLWGVIIKSSNQFFISRYYGNEVFAEFSNGFMELPFVGMIISAISTVLLPVISGMDKGNGMNDNILSVWKSALYKSARLIFPALIYSIFMSDLLTSCMYGDKYSSSGVYFALKNFEGLFYIIPFAPVILAIGKTKEYARVHCITAMLIVTLDFIAVKLTNSAVLIAIISVFSDIFKIALLFNVIKSFAACSIGQMLPIKQLCSIGIASAISAFVAFLLTILIDCNKFLLLTISLCAFISTYYLLCLIFKITYKDIVSSMISRTSLQKFLLRIIP